MRSLGGISPEFLYLPASLPPYAVSTSTSRPAGKNLAAPSAPTTASFCKTSATYSASPIPTSPPTIQSRTSACSGVPSPLTMARRKVPAASTCASAAAHSGNQVVDGLARCPVKGREVGLRRTRLCRGEAPQGPRPARLREVGANDASGPAASPELHARLAARRAPVCGSRGCGLLH